MTNDELIIIFEQMHDGEISKEQITNLFNSLHPYTIEVLKGFYLSGPFDLNILRDYKAADNNLRNYLYKEKLNNIINE